MNTAPSRRATSRLRARARGSPLRRWEGRYAADVEAKDALHVALVPSPHPAARILGIDTTRRSRCVAPITCLPARNWRATNPLLNGLDTLKRAAAWSPATPLTGMPAARPATAPAAVTPNRPLEGRTSGRQRSGTWNSSASSPSQASGADVVQQGAAGIGRIGGVDRAAGELPQQPASRPCRRPGRRRRRRPPSVSSHSHLGRREVRVEDQAGGRPDPAPR